MTRGQSVNKAFIYLFNCAALTHLSRLVAQVLLITLTMNELQSVYLIEQSHWDREQARTKPGA